MVIERRLVSELAAQQAIVATRPPDRRRELTQAREALSRALRDRHGAEAYFGGATGRLRDAGGLARVRREGRDAHARALADLDEATDRLRATRAVGARVEWDGTHGWRLGDVARI